MPVFMVGYGAPQYGESGRKPRIAPNCASRGIDAVAPDLKSYADLAKYQHLFTVPEAEPQGRLLACPVAAWQCMDAERITGLGLDFKAAVRKWMAANEDTWRSWIPTAM
jgi:glycine betaine/proline transport system substrate-binding protein